MFYLLSASSRVVTVNLLSKVRNLSHFLTFSRGSTWYEKLVL